MDGNSIVTIKVGTYLQGDGGASRGALILDHKQADNYTDVILCYAAESPHDPFVVWTYNHERGTCSKGEYFNRIDYAVSAYAEREF
jgi:hypothetical protein